MLHIVKQFIFGVQLAIRSDFQNGSEFQSMVDNLDNQETQEEAKNALKDFFRELAQSKDYDYNFSEEEAGSVDFQEEVKEFLTKIGLNNNLSELGYNAIAIKLFEYKTQSDNIVDVAKTEAAELKTDVELESVGEFNSPVLEESAILEGLRKVDVRGAHNRETIGTYLHDGEQKDIILKKDGLGKYYVELDRSTGAFKDDIHSETTNVKTVDEVYRIVDELTSGSVGINKVVEDSQEQNQDNEVIKTQETITERDDINYNSLNKIISHMSFSELKELKSFFENNNRKSEWKHMRSLGYDPDGMFGNFEMQEIIDLVNSVVENQEKLQETTDYREKLKIIFDYNVDGQLDSQTHFYTQEKEIFEKVESQEEFENILKNLGYTDYDQFNSEFNDHYYAARNKFKNQLARSLHGEYVLDPGLMMKDPQAKEKLNTTLAEIDSQVSEALTMNAKVQKLEEEYPLLANQFQEHVKSVSRTAYLQSVGGVIGSVNGVAASFNVEELTSSIIDTASIGIVNGVLGIQVGKEVYRSDSGKTAIGIGAVNFIPYVGATHEFYEEKVSGIKDIFQSTVDNGMKLTVGGVGTVGAAMVGIDYTKVDETTAEGISQMKDQMKTMLSAMLDNISKNEGFEKTGLEDNSENRAAYDQLMALYQATGANEIAKQDILTGALNNYERELFNTAEGFNVTGLSIGLAKLLTYIPVIGIHGEYKDQNWEERRFVISQIEENANFAVEEGNFTTIEKMDQLDKDLAVYESGFSGATRWNKDARAFLEPTNSIADRWEAIKKLSSYVNALEAVKLEEFLVSKDNESDAVKLAIISTLGAWTRKSFDVQESDTPEKLIKLDSQRRGPFNEMFGFDTSKYAQEYYDILGQQETLESTTQYGTSFDAISALNVGGASQRQKDGSMSNRVSGIDMLHGSVDMVANTEGNPIQVEITDEADKLAFAQNVKKLAVNHGDALHNLAAGIEDGSIALYFYKDPDGFNDRILPVVKKQAIVEADKSVGVYNPVNETTPWALFAIGDVDERSSDTNEDGQSSTPDYEENNDNPGGNSTPGDQSGGRGDNSTVVDNTPVQSFESKVTGEKLTEAGATILTNNVEKVDHNKD